MCVASISAQSDISGASDRPAVRSTYMKWTSPGNSSTYLCTVREQLNSLSPVNIHIKRNNRFVQCNFDVLVRQNLNIWFVNATDKLLTLHKGTYDYHLLNPPHALPGIYSQINSVAAFRYCFKLLVYHHNYYKKQ